MNIKKPRVKITRKTKKKIKQGAIKLSLLVVLLGVSTYYISQYFEAYRWNWQSPVVFQTPLVIEKRDIALLSPIPGYTVNHDIVEMVDGIHLLESTRGTAPSGLHISCMRQGESNEYGYNALNKQCFRTHEEATRVVTAWVTDHLEEFGGDVNMTLCYYNSGKTVESCEYSDNYQASKGGK